MGKRKCRVKNRPRHAPPKENLPHTIITISSPMGRTPTRLVITVALQNDMCPQGKTYLKKEAPIVKIKRTTPIFHRFDFEKDLKYIPLPICAMIITNTQLQKLAWIKRKSAPPILFSITDSTELKLMVTPAIKVLEITKPEITCNVIQTPLKEPKFHHMLMFFVEEKLAPNPRLKDNTPYIIQLILPRLS
jgi:hypothetical protein